MTGMPSLGERSLLWNSTFWCSPSQLKEEMVSYPMYAITKKALDMYEKYKVAKTLEEARRLGASKVHKGFFDKGFRGKLIVTDAEGNSMILPLGKQEPVIGFATSAKGNFVKLLLAKQAPVEKAAKDEKDFRFHVTLQKPNGAVVGLRCKKVCDANGSESLEIESISKGGLFHAWNQQCANGHPGHAVREGDRIVSVNAVSASARSMKDQIKNNQLLNFTFFRAQRAECGQAIFFMAQSIAEDNKKREASLPEPNVTKKQKSSAVFVPSPERQQ